MPSAFKTKNGAPDVDIIGLGLLQGDGQSGISLDRAARRMPELQDKKGKPLTGNALTDAATAWADTVGLTVAAVAEDNLTTTPPVAPAEQEA